MFKGGLLLNKIAQFSSSHKNTADHRFLLKPEFSTSSLLAGREAGLYAFSAPFRMAEMVP